MTPTSATLARDKKHADTPTLFLPAHFVEPTAGRLHRAGPRYEYRFVE